MGSCDCKALCVCDEGSRLMVCGWLQPAAQAGEWLLRARPHQARAAGHLAAAACWTGRTAQVEWAAAAPGRGGGPLPGCSWPATAPGGGGARSHSQSGRRSSGWPAAAPPPCPSCCPPRRPAARQAREVAGGVGACMRAGLVARHQHAQGKTFSGQHAVHASPLPPALLRHPSTTQATAPRASLLPAPPPAHPPCCCAVCPAGPRRARLRPPPPPEPPASPASPLPGPPAHEPPPPQPRPLAALRPWRPPQPQPTQPRGSWRAAAPACGGERTRSLSPVPPGRIPGHSLLPCVCCCGRSWLGLRRTREQMAWRGAGQEGGGARGGGAWACMELAPHPSVWTSLRAAPSP